MSRGPDKDVGRIEPPASEAAGKVEFDSRGNSVWRWAKDVLESTSVLLKRLENKDLALEPTRKIPVLQEDGDDDGRKPAGGKPGSAAAAGTKAPSGKGSSRHPALAPDKRRDSGGGFDPYNSR